jgi:ribonuclease HI
MFLIYFDGLCERTFPGGPANPGGVACYGFLVVKDGKILHRKNGVIGEGKGMTNNLAEFAALEKAGMWLRNKRINEPVIVRGDSELVINQVVGNWKVKSKTSRRFVPRVKKLFEGMDVRFEWVPREENRDADMLTRIAYESYMKQKN